MAKKEKQLEPQPVFTEVQRFERCPVEGCDVREWHRHETKEEGGAHSSRILGYGTAQLLEDELPPPTEPEPQPTPAQGRATRKVARERRVVERAQAAAQAEK